VKAGRKVFHSYCAVCHGLGAVAGGTPPDLRALTPEKHVLWDAIVRGGMHWQIGMVGFGEELSQQQTDNIHHYLIERATFAIEGYKAPADQAKP
jgi:quinohemoprotein ethanol dehydrogenase